MGLCMFAHTQTRQNLHIVNNQAEAHIFRGGTPTIKGKYVSLSEAALQKGQSMSRGTFSSREVRRQSVSEMDKYKITYKQE